MKRLLITGKNGYIARQFEAFIRQFPEEYGVTSVSLRGDDWREMDLSPYDVILHTAGIVHIRETPENAHLYYEVNRDLTIELAGKAKNAGVKQFVFLSTVSVYGMDEGVITQETVPNPVTHYGQSKLQAEEGILPFQTENFTVSILRPPMVYGDGCTVRFTRKGRKAFGNLVYQHAGPLSYEGDSRSRRGLLKCHKKGNGC